MPKNISGNVLHQYVRNKRGQSVGVLAAVPHHEDGSILIGWSRANTTNGDCFNKAEGLRIALERSAKSRFPAVPYSMIEDYIRFKARCVKYYKDKRVHEPFRGSSFSLLTNKAVQIDAGKHHHPILLPHEFE
jgi:hypothetical protein